VEVSLWGANLDWQSGALQERIAQLLAETASTVRCAGRYEQSQLAELMSSVDWVVVPSIWWETGPLVIHEAPLTAGFGAEVVATIVEQAVWSLSAPVLRVAAPDTSYPIASLEQLYVPSAQRVLEAIRRVVQAA